MTPDEINEAARMLAQTPAAAKATTGKPAELQAAMHQTFGPDYRAGRVAVWQWIARLEKAKDNRETA